MGAVALTLGMSACTTGLEESGDRGDARELETVTFINPLPWMQQHVNIAD